MFYKFPDILSLYVFFVAKCKKNAHFNPKKMSFYGGC